MNSLREITRSSGKQRSLKQWASLRQIQYPLSVRQIMKGYAPPTLWGFADLHAHPAAHLAFGADIEGESLLFWGKPGLRLEDAAATMPSDLAPCFPEVHTNILNPKPVTRNKSDIRQAVHDTVAAWGKSNCPPGCDLNSLADSIADAVENLAQDPVTIWSATFAAVVTVEHIVFATCLAAVAIALGPGAVAVALMADPIFELMDVGLAAAVASAVLIIVNDPNLDPAKLATRSQIVAAGEKHNNNCTYEIGNRFYAGGKFCFHHAADGWPTFNSWPNASSLLHQQMHISWIRRAWQGGLRLMIASTVDNQLFSNLWNRALMMAQLWPEVDPNFDFNSAVTQLTFIRALVAANSSWMEIVETPAAARAAVAADKLAVILGVEMDSLTADQIIRLKNEQGVRQVVPIHLANNSFGGVATYDDLFNTNNWYLHGGRSFWFEHNLHLDLFLKIFANESVDFKLDPSNTQYLEAYPPLGVVMPTKVNLNDWPGMQYDVAAGFGHMNQLGLEGFTSNPFDSPNFHKLMKAGLLIDLAHMSSQSQVGAVLIAQRYHYPLMNSHGGIRPDTLRPNTSERDMRRGNVGTLSEEGGVFGLGTSGYRKEKKDSSGNTVKDASGNTMFVAPNDQVEHWIQLYWDAWNAMKFRGVAIGTDANGFSEMIPCSNKLVTYPFTVQTPGGAQNIPNSTAGSRTFDFEGDGIAHYGMLADFVQALRKVGDIGADIADRFLARTAEETINMWEKVEQAAKGC